jgi:hypothetical protein
MITQGSGPMYQYGKHSLFVRRMVVRAGMEIEVGVCGFMVRLYDPMSHRKRRWPSFSISIVNLMFSWTPFRW